LVWILSATLIATGARAALKAMKTKRLDVADAADRLAKVEPTGGRKGSVCV